MRGKAPRRIEDCPVCSNDAVKLDEHKETLNGRQRLLRYYECQACGYSFSMYSNGNIKGWNEGLLDVCEFIELNK